nr:uncharacterized protein LOC111764381 [Dasypus novemcinctus]
MVVKSPKSLFCYLLPFLEFMGLFGGPQGRSYRFARLRPAEWKAPSMGNLSGSFGPADDSSSLSFAGSSWLLTGKGGQAAERASHDLPLCPGCSPASGAAPCLRCPARALQVPLPCRGRPGTPAHPPDLPARTINVCLVPDAAFAFARRAGALCWHLSLLDRPRIHPPLPPLPPHCTRAPSPLNRAPAGASGFPSTVLLAFPLSQRHRARGPWSEDWADLLRPGLIHSRCSINAPGRSVHLPRPPCHPCLLTTSKPRLHLCLQRGEEGVRKLGRRQAAVPSCLGVSPMLSPQAGHAPHPKTPFKAP